MFANVFHSTTFKFKEDEEFDRLFNYTSQEFGEDVKFDEMLTTAGGCVTNKFEEQVNMFTTDKFEENMNIQEVQCPVLRRGCNQEEFLMFEQQWGRYAECNHEVDVRELRQQLLN